MVGEDREGGLAPLASSKVGEVEKETTGTIAAEKFFDLQM